MKKKLSFILPIVFAIIIFSTVTYATGAWLASMQKADGSITLGQAVEVKVNPLTNASTVLPGERISTDVITFDIPENTSDCYVRAEIKPNSSYYIMDSETTVVGDTDYSWIVFEDYYYLVNSSVTSLSALPEGNQLHNLTAGTTVKLKLNNVLVNPALSIINAGDSANIKISAEAVQSANYSTEIWADSFGANVTIGEIEVIDDNFLGKYSLVSTTIPEENQEDTMFIGLETIPSSTYSSVRNAPQSGEKHYYTWDMSALQLTAQFLEMAGEMSGITDEDELMNIMMTDLQTLLSSNFISYEATLFTDDFRAAMQSQLSSMPEEEMEAMLSQFGAKAAHAILSITYGKNVMMVSNTSSYQPITQDKSSIQNVQTSDGFTYSICEGENIAFFCKANDAEIVDLSAPFINYNGDSYNVLGISYSGLLTGEAQFSANTKKIICGYPDLALIGFSGATALEELELNYTVNLLTSTFYSDTLSSCKSTIKKVKLPDGLTAIGYGAFRDCTSLTSVEIPSTVADIESYVFYNCTSLTSIILPEDLTSIGSYVFQNCTSLKAINVNSNNTAYSSNEGVLYNKEQTNLIIYPVGKESKEYVVPNTVTTISQNSFQGATNLEKLTLPFIGNTLNGTSNTHFGFIFGAYNYTNHSSYVPSSLKEVVITGGTSIVDNAFKQCSSITKITLPDGLTSIGSYAFSGCSSLNNINIPNSVATIANYAFGACTSLDNVEIPNSVTSIGGSAFSGCTTLEKLTLPFIGNTLNGTSNTHFGFIFGAYNYLSNPNAVPSSLKKVVITNSTSIADYAFYGCNKIASIDISDTVTSIGQYAFQDCLLENIVLPKSAKNIKGNAFNNCTSLTKVFYKGSMLERYNDISLTSTGNAYVKIATWYYADEWEYVNGEPVGQEKPELPYTVQMVLTGNYMVIAPKTLDANKTLVGVNVTEFDATLYNNWDESTFAMYFQLLLIALDIYENPPDDIYMQVFASLATDMVSYQNGLFTETFRNALAEEMLGGLLSGTESDIDGTVDEMGFKLLSMFASVIYNTQLFVVPTDFKYSFVYETTAGIVTDTVDGAKYKIYPESKIALFDSYGGTNDTADISTSLTYNGNEYNVIGTNGPDLLGGQVRFGSSLKKLTYSLPVLPVEMGLGSMLDSSSNSLEEVYFNLTLSPINADAVAEGIDFEDNKTIKVVQLPNGLTQISSYAFEDCTSLTTVVIPESLTQICNNAFSGCTLLSNINIPLSLTTVDSNAFLSCSSLVMVNFKGTESDKAKISISGGNEYLINALWMDLDNLTVIDGVVFNKDKTTLIQYPTDKTDTSYTVPSTVTSIANNAFKGNTYITSITLQNGLTNIGNYAFANCSALSNINIPTGVTNIGEHAFVSCTSLTSIEIPSTVTSISNFMFYCCISLSSVTLPNTINSIGDYAFADCRILSNTSFLQDGVTTIGNHAFHDCHSLTSIELPNTVTSIGSDAFANCDALISIEIPNSVKSIGDYAFAYCDLLASVTLPEGLTEIDFYLFYQCTSLKTVNIPSTVQAIRSYAFEFCSSLTSIEIPSSVTSIGVKVFQSCKALKEINVASNNNYYCSENGVLFNKNKTQLIAYPIGKTDTTYVVPNTVTRINESAFYEFKYLTSISFPLSLTRIDSYAFGGGGSGQIRYVVYEGTEADRNNMTISYGNSITDVTWAYGGIVEIDGVLFNKDVTMLVYYPSTKTDTAYVVPNTVTTIAKYAFKDCTSITRITLPAGLTTIGDYAFRDCTALKTINIPSTVTSLGVGAFYYCDSLNKISLPDGITSIGDETFFGCVSLYSVTLPITVTSVGGYAFYGNNDSLTIYYGGTEEDKNNITIDDTNYNLINAEWKYGGSVEIDGVLFNQDITTLIKYPSDKTDTSYTIPNTVTSISESAFSSCRSLISITLPAGLTNVDINAFNYCTNLKTVYYECSEEDVDKIIISTGNDYLLNAVWMPTSTVEEDGVIFNSSKTILIQYPSTKTDTTYVVPSTVTRISNSAFKDCSSLTSITIPNSVKVIKNNAFANCSKLITVNYQGEYSEIENISIETGNDVLVNAMWIPISTVTVDDVIFNSDKTVLIKYPNTKTDTSYTVPSTVTKIGNYAFYNAWRYLENITLPDGLKTIGYKAFDTCAQLTSLTIPNTVTSIGDYAFNKCWELSSLTLSDNLTSLGAYAFKESAVTSITIPGGVKTIKSYTFIDSSLTNIILSEGVTTIEERAFYGCETVTDITLPDSITSIGGYAFSNCEALTSITIPSKVKVIESYTFYGCDSLKTITFQEGLTTIEVWSFEYCKSLTSLTLPSTVTDFDSQSVDECESLAEINVASGNANYYSIDGVLFNANNVLLKYPQGKQDTTYTIPSGTEWIGVEAFFKNKSIRSLMISSSVTGMASEAFHECTAITEINVASANSNYSSENGILFNKNKTVLLRYPSGKTDETYTVPSTVTKISAFAFSYNDYITSVIVPESVTNIYDRAFYHCDLLSYITLPRNLKEIVFHAFDYCKVLTTVFYTGTEANKANIEIGVNNSYLTNATWYYSGEWEYVDGVPTPTVTK